MSPKSNLYSSIKKIKIIVLLYIDDLIVIIDNYKEIDKIDI